MTNVHMSWTQLKTKMNAYTLYFCLQGWNWQIYILIGADAFISYIPRPDKFDQMIIDEETKVIAQANYDDFDANYKATAVETEGVVD